MLEEPQQPHYTKNSRELIHKYAGISLVGLVVGAFAMSISLGLCAGARRLDGSRDWQHFMILMPTVGLIYSVFVGLWSAWVRRSVYWIFVAVVAGLFLGVAWYVWFDLFHRNGLLTFGCGPSLLGGCASAIYGWRIQPNWASSFVRLIARFLKGLVAGLALGMVASLIFQSIDSIPGAKLKILAYVAAMTISSCFFLVLLYWAGEFSQRTGRATGVKEA